MVMRIGGLASGMDIDGLVEKLMQAEKAPLNKLYQTKQKYEWQRDAYREVNTKLKAFDTFLFENMTLKKDMYKSNVTSSNSAISATTSAGNKGTLNIDSVSQLAQSGNAVSTGTIAQGTAATKQLKDLGLDLNFDASGEAKVEMKVLQASGEMKDISLTFKNTDTLSDVVKTLKDNTGLNAFYDEASGQLAISTQATGAGENIKYETVEEVTEGSVTHLRPTEKEAVASIFVESGEGFFKGLGFANPKVLAKGENAKLTVNGAAIERQSNTFEINGFNITLNNEYNKVSEDPNVVTTKEKPITLTANTDTDNMVDKIKKFVETYNGLVESFTATSKEKKYRDFPPLTDEQKEDMTEDQIKVWEEKAKSGVLRSDSILSSALSSMRSTMYSKGGSSNPLMDTLYEMGITTSNKTSENGKLVIDEDKLRAAISKDPDAVFSTFSNSNDATPGLVQKLRANISTATINIEKKAGKSDSVNNTFNLGRALNDMDTRIDAWKIKLSNAEARYWKQFGAMETAINKANQQSASLFAGQIQ